MMYWWERRQRENRERNVRLRRERLERARAIGTHSKVEWLILHSLFDRCCICGVPKSDLYGNALSKDHITPIYQGGCDCIGNIQPVCRNCNSRKGPEAIDYRCVANQNWSAEFSEKMAELYAYEE